MRHRSRSSRADRDRPVLDRAFDQASKIAYRVVPDNIPYSPTSSTESHSADLSNDRRDRVQFSARPSLHATFRGIHSPEPDIVSPGYVASAPRLVGRYTPIRDVRGLPSVTTSSPDPYTSDFCCLQRGSILRGPGSKMQEGRVSRVGKRIFLDHLVPCGGALTWSPGEGDGPV